MVEINEKTERLRKVYNDFLVAKTGIAKKVQKLSFEEFLEWERLRRLRQKETWDLKRTNRLNDKALLAERRKTDTVEQREFFSQMTLDDKYVPGANVFLDFKKSLDGKDLDEVRGTKYPYVKEEVWMRFVRMYFSFLHSNPEQIAIELKKRTDKAIISIQEQIDNLTGNQKLLIKPSEILEYSKTIGTLTNQLANISSQYAKDLSTLGLVGGKVRGGVNIQIINRIPRPMDPFKTTSEKTGKPIDIRTIGSDQDIAEVISNDE